MTCEFRESEGDRAVSWPPSRVTLGVACCENLGRGAPLSEVLRCGKPSTMLSLLPPIDSGWPSFASWKSAFESWNALNMCPAIYLMTCE